jgi:hypothetical protein
MPYINENKLLKRIHKKLGRTHPTAPVPLPRVALILCLAESTKP